MEWKYALIIMIVLCVIFLSGIFLAKPLKLLLRLVVWAVAGTVIILMLNVVLGQLGMRIALNPATILTAGVLNVPGAVLLVLLNYFFTA